MKKTFLRKGAFKKLSTKVCITVYTIKTTSVRNFTHAQPANTNPAINFAFEKYVNSD